MPDLNRILDQIDRLDQEATKGPWTIDPSEGHAWAVGNGQDGFYVQSLEPDAEFIALARTALPTLAKLARNLLEIRNNAQRQADDINGGDALDLTKLSTLTEVTRSINLAIEDALGADDE